MGARPRYIVTTMRAAAGSFLTATAVATVVVMGSGPASAASASQAPVQSLVDEVATGFGTAPSARLDGIREEMDQAVRMHLVTAEQAEQFVDQMQERISRGF